MDATVINSDEGGIGGISPLVIREEKLRAEFEEYNREIEQLEKIVSDKDLSLDKKIALMSYLELLKKQSNDIDSKIDEISGLSYF